MELVFKIATPVLCVIVLSLLFIVRKILLNLKKGQEERRSAIFIEAGNNLTKEEQAKLDKFIEDYRAGKIKTRTLKEEDFE